LIELLLAAALFVGTHLGISGTRLRDILVSRIGERFFLVLYSVIALVTISLFSDAYVAAPYVTLWGQLYALWPVAVAVMLLAFMLVVVGLTTPSPTLVGAEALIRRPDAVRGILRVTRHPFLSGVALWAGIHLLINGDLAALILFGSLGVLAVVGARSIDGKRARSLGDGWGEFAAQTSAIPFVAIVQGRNRFSIAEIGWWRIGLALLAFGGLLYFHARLFGVSPAPI
jgi:uncharacterized membrane protein